MAENRSLDGCGWVDALNLKSITNALLAQRLMCLRSNFGEVEFPQRKRFKADLLIALEWLNFGFQETLQCLQLGRETLEPLNRT